MRGLRIERLRGLISNNALEEVAYSSGYRVPTRIKMPLASDKLFILSFLCLLTGVYVEENITRNVV